MLVGECIVNRLTMVSGKVGDGVRKEERKRLPVKAAKTRKAKLPEITNRPIKMNRKLELLCDKNKHT